PRASASFPTRRSSDLGGDVAQAQRCAHDLKSVAGSLGMPALHRGAAALELACEQGATEASIEPLLQDVVRALAPLMRALPEHMRSEEHTSELQSQSNL